MSVDQDAVAALLAKSRAAHMSYRRQNNDVKRLEGIQAAYDLRTAAEALDPTLSAPIWRDEPEKFQHDSVMAFYRQQLGLVAEAEDRRDKALKAAAKRLAHDCKNNPRFSEDDALDELKKLANG